MYTKITDPITNIKYNINSRQGKNILRKYLNFLNGGASRTIVTAAISESGGNRNKSDLVLSIYPESFSKRHLNKYFNFGVTRKMNKEVLANFMFIIHYCILYVH